VLYPTLAAAQSVPSGVTQIIPDGRTATTVTTNGSVTGITTATTAGANAFNSFSQFKVGGGNTANLYVPGGSTNLINVVRDGAVVVNGIVNSYKNGQIGGNVYFADPYGFVVGKGGVVNVGTLNVTTPSKEFVDGVIGPQGQINQAATQQLMSGNVPLSNLTVNDDNAGGTAFSPAAVVVNGFNSGDANQNGVFDAGETWHFTDSTHTALAGQHQNTAVATGTPPVGGNVSASDVANYFGSSPAIRIVKSVNGDTPPNRS